MTAPDCHPLAELLRNESDPHEMRLSLPEHEDAPVPKKKAVKP